MDNYPSGLRATSDTVELFRDDSFSDGHFTGEWITIQRYHGGIMKIYRGTIITCDGNSTIAHYLVEENGKIVFVGNKLPDSYPPDIVTDLENKAICPAFADTHIHLMSHALFAGGLEVREVKTNGDMIEKINDYAQQHREKIVLGFGASPHSVEEQRVITRKELDLACPDRPVFIVKYDGHAAVVNSALLQKLPRKIMNERGYDAESGLLTQEAFFRATDFVTSTVSLPDTLARMLNCVDTMAAAGIGMIHSVSGVGFPADLDVTLESIFAKGLRNDIAYRIFFQTMNVEKVIKRKLPRIGGCFATALDGCFGSMDAAMSRPYRGTKQKGVLYYTDEQVCNFTKAANRAGLQIEMHAIGDRAFDQAVRAIAASLKDFPRQDHRHTIIHACLPTQKGLDLCVKHGIAIALQPAFLDWAQEPLSYLKQIMGDRAYTILPLKTMLKAGLIMSGGSDGPCTQPDPIAGIHAAVNHYTREEALTTQQALDMYTRNAAWTGFDEHERGSLEIGKRADMVILDRNILAQPKKKINETKVETLLLGGRPYAAKQGRLEMFARTIGSTRKI